MKEQFINKLWALNKQGDAESIFIEVEYTIKYKFTIEGNKITMAYLAKKYNEYIKHIKAINADRDQKYKSKPLDIKSWLMKNKYNEDYTTINSELDNYIYGY